MNRGFQQIVVRVDAAGRKTVLKRPPDPPPQPFPGRPKLLALMVNRICRQWGALA